jgi:HTH-type transcriptional regulator/antitoxin HipB
MSSIMDKLRLPQDLGAALRQARKAAGLTATEVAQRSGRSRDVLHRLERGDDVNLSSLFDILRACGLSLQLVSAGLPTLAEMRQRFAQDDDDSPT